MSLEFDDFFEDSERFRIHEVLPKGRSGLDVFVKYYDSLSSKQFVKTEKHPHIWSSVEINLKKYGYSDMDELLSDLKGQYPEFVFEEKPYGLKRDSLEGYSARDFYSNHDETSIIWAVGPRGGAPKFFLDKKYFNSEEKQIFIANYSDRFKARTRTFFDEDRLFKGIDFFESYLSKKGLSHSGIDILGSESKGKFIDVKCEKSTRSKLVLEYPSLFRNFVYESNLFSDEARAEELLSELTNLNSFGVHVDRAKVIESRVGAFNFEYKVRFFGTLNSSFVKDLKSVVDFDGKCGFSLRKDHKKIVIGGGEELYDPLNLSSPTKQLKDFFPSHSSFNPEMSLSSQVNTSNPIFSHYKREQNGGGSELERAVRDAFSFYLKNSVVVDLEVTGYDKYSDDLTGEVFMAVLESESENKIYMTKKVWLGDSYKNFFEQEAYKTNRDVSLVFVNDEIDLINTLDSDVSKYEFIIGHNFIGFDQKHLVKYNDLKKIKNDSDLNRVRQLNINSIKPRLWRVSDNKILDTYKYVKRRIHVLENYKLSSFGGFDKPLDYDLMEEYVNSGDKKKILKVLNYTILDGVESNNVSKMLLRNAVLESVASNKTLSSVFSVDPIKNFSDCGSRNYFMNLNTYKNRHDMSFNRNFNKLKERSSPSELIYSMFQFKDQKVGFVSGSLVFPKAAIEASKEVINNNHPMRFIYSEMLEECNPLIKADLLNKLHSFLHIPFDKVKNFVESSDLEFGKRYSPGDVFKTLESSLEESEYFVPNAQGFSDFELARMNYIFCAEYRVSRRFKQKGSFFYDYAMLDINNVFADYIDIMRNDLVAKTQGFYVTSRSNSGYVLGEIEGLNFKDDGLIGRLNGYNLFLNRSRLSEKKKINESKVEKKRRLDNVFVNEMVDYFLKNDVYQKDVLKKFHNEIYSRGSDFLKSRSDYVKLLTGVNPLKSRGTGSLF